jgi:pimeloyl-ACP methyl ester carboxylesterase
MNSGQKKMNSPDKKTVASSGFAEVNGIKLYYEICGQGDPILLLHGGGSTIQSSFGRIIPQLAQNKKVIAVELQNHGRSGFRETETFEQDAIDVAALLTSLNIKKANLLGFSNGGTTALLVAANYPGLVNKLIICSGAIARSGFPEGFFEFMKKGTLRDMPEELKIEFLKVNPDSSKLLKMFERDRDRMIAFHDIDKNLIRQIKAPALVLNGDRDVVSNEHAVEICRLIANSRLCILPGVHGECIGEITTLKDGIYKSGPALEIIESFLRE